MAIKFHPGYGTILYCDFSHQTEPEMVKSRPVVVVSRRNTNVRLCTVVPLSSTQPEKIQSWHHKKIQVVNGIKI
ncbi:type II toxin-antitoxin system PemK/MazF family toxin [Planctomycetaceae bacterium]|nr:type II toxin-antitoxin system PemK/MazF family toxin [Planctomycetaceae bacterium]